MFIATDCFAVVASEITEALKPVIDFISKNVSITEEVTVAKEGLDKWIKVFQIVQGYEVWQSYGGWINNTNQGYLVVQRKD